LILYQDYQSGFGSDLRGQVRALLVPSVQSIQKRLDTCHAWHNEHSAARRTLGLQMPNEAMWSINVPEPTAIRQRRNVEPTSKQSANLIVATHDCST